MPILNIYLVEGQHSDFQITTLMTRSSYFFAEVLACPVDRIRVFVNMHSPRHVCIGANITFRGDLAAPYFSFIVLEGRSVETRQRLLAGFTDIIEEILCCPRNLIRGSATAVMAENWSIGGVAASVVRQKEIESRAPMAPT